MGEVKNGAMQISCAICMRLMKIVIDWKFVIYVEGKRSMYYTCVCGEKHLIQINERTSPRRVCQETAVLSWHGGKLHATITDRSHGGMRCKVSRRFLNMTQVGDIVQVSDDRLIIKQISREHVGLQYFDQQNFSPQQREIVRNQRK